MFDQQRYQPDEGVQCVETLRPDDSPAVCLVRQRAVTQVNTHLCTQPEKTGDEVIALQDSLLVHLDRVGRDGVCDKLDLTICG